MDIDQIKLFKYLNKEYHSSFSIDQVSDSGQVPVVTGELKQDAFLVHVRESYGLALTRTEPDPTVFSKWSSTVIDDKKFAWLVLKL